MRDGVITEADTCREFVTPSVTFARIPVTLPESSVTFTGIRTGRGVRSAGRRSDPHSRRWRRPAR